MYLNVVSQCFYTTFWLRWSMTTTEPSSPYHDQFGFNPLAYFLSKPNTRVREGRLHYSGIPIQTGELVSAGKSVLFDHAKLRITVSTGTVDRETGKTTYDFKEKPAWEGALERAVAGYIAPQQAVDFVDDTLGIGWAKGVFTIKEYGGLHGNNHAFTSPAVGLPDTVRFEILDHLYDAARAYLEIVTAPPFVAAVSQQPLTKSLDDVARERARELVPSGEVKLLPRYPTQPGGLESFQRGWSATPSGDQHGLCSDGLYDDI